MNKEVMIQSAIILTGVIALLVIHDNLPNGFKLKKA